MQALTREDSLTGKYYGCSAHMLWVGERTRQLDCGHLEFVRGLGNPIGVKISDKCVPEELIELLDIINPDNAAGKVTQMSIERVLADLESNRRGRCVKPISQCAWAQVTLVVRMGSGKVRKHLPGLIRAVQASKRNVLWISDPVHGNTITAETGQKTRPLYAIMDEIIGFFEVGGP